MESPCVSPKTGTPLWIREGNSCNRHITSKRVHSDCTTNCPGYLAIHQSDANVRAPDASNDALTQFIPTLVEGNRYNNTHLAYLLGMTVTELMHIHGKGESETTNNDVEMTDDSRRARTQDVDREEEGSEFEDEDGNDCMGLSASQRDDYMEIDDGPGPSRIPIYHRGLSTISSVSNTSHHSFLPEQSLARPEVREPQQTQRKVFHILYVPDPSRASASLTQSQADLAYTDRTIRKDAYQEIQKAIPGFIFGKRGGNPESGYTTVRVSEWVRTML